MLCIVGGRLLPVSTGMVKAHHPVGILVFLLLIRLVAFLCVMVTCRLVIMFLIQPAVDESRGDWSIASEMALKDTLSKAPSMIYILYLEISEH